MIDLIFALVLQVGASGTSTICGDRTGGNIILKNACWIEPTFHPTSVTTVGYYKSNKQCLERASELATETSKAQCIPVNIPVK
jgi:hypothetical protein